LREGYRIDGTYPGPRRRAIWKKIKCIPSSPEKESEKAYAKRGARSRGGVSVPIRNQKCRENSQLDPSLPKKDQPNTLFVRKKQYKTP